MLGALSLVTAFTPLIWLQVIGGFVGIAGIVLARRARKADYRKDLTTAIGMLCSVTGTALCFVVPLLSLLSNVALLFMTSRERQRQLRTLARDTYTTSNLITGRATL